MVQEVAGGGVESCLGTQLAGRRYRHVDDHPVRAAESADARADLAENLRLAENCRIKSRCHRRQVEDGVKSVQSPVRLAGAVGTRGIRLDTLTGLDDAPARVSAFHAAAERFSAAAVHRGQAPRAETEMLQTSQNCHGPP